MSRLRTKSSFKLTSSAREFVILGVAAAVFFALPWLMPFIGAYEQLATRFLIWGIFALGFDILLGFTGLLSFGHAAFWGIGSYVAGYYLLHVSNSLLIAMLLGVLVVGVVAWLLGLITLRRHGIYFAILTLAFAEMFYYLVLSPLQTWTGGDNGLTGIPSPKLLGMPLEGYGMHAFVAAWTLLAFYLARRIKDSPYGLILRGIKANETRLSFTGVNVFRYKLMAFVISGLYAGLAGTLDAAYETYVPTESLHWTTSGEVVIMSVIGGVGTLFGPMIGAGIVLYLENVLSAVTRQWNLILGLIFMGFVIFLPGGIVGSVRHLFRSRDGATAPARTEQDSTDPAREP
ncbi:branched-chain amino acid ABC transporter permease [soil metagenome]